MKRPYIYILHSGFYALLLVISVVAEPARADSIIRIIGERTAKSPNNPGEPAVAEPPRYPATENTTIRIIGDKIETHSPEQPVVKEVADKVQRTKTVAEEESVSEKAAELMLMQRLAALKAEAERKAAENAEKERLGKLKADK